MNYDEYIKEIEKFSEDDVVSRLIKHLVSWKDDDTNVLELADTIERFFGNSWIENKETHSHLYRMWSAFKKEAIEGIAGMTMNERLYWFGLFERFEKVESEPESEQKQKVIYAKVCANI
ncbi:hypothetical protein [Idiomarina sp.]|uniref:hypothetical protein n=1 Tax=Idiomarina sp. TaxID=1874361 RepID=UPI003A9572E0